MPLWARVGPGGMAKKVPATIVITSPGRADKESGTGPRLTLAGDPGELTMFGAGRQGAANVEITGDAELIAQLRSASSWESDLRSLVRLWLQSRSNRLASAPYQEE